MRSNNALSSPLKSLFLALLLCIPVGCASMASRQLADNLSQAILNQNDPEIVRDGAPAYLVLLDGLIAGSPDDQALLLAGARLYGSYATVFVEDAERARRLSEKALDYARRALCLRLEQVCRQEQESLQPFTAALDGAGRDDLPVLFTYGAAWAGWIQAHSDDWNAIADLAKVEAIMDRVVGLDETFEGGQAHVYLGVMRSQLSPALGGKPERGKDHFERAIELSDGHNLYAKVEYARQYARLTFDQQLHDRLLQEVLAADPQYPDLTLINTLAQRQAATLLEQSGDYF